MKYLKTYEAKKKKVDPSDNFKLLVQDILVDLSDRKFNILVSNDKSTYNINITYRGQRDSLTGEGRFKWEDIKNNIIMLVGYLQDVYPKIEFTQFMTSEIRRPIKGKSTAFQRKPYPSMRSILSETDGIKCYKLDDLVNSLDDKDIMSYLNISCLVRFRGKMLV